MSNTGFTPVNISVALVISGLLHLLLFYLPDDLPVDQGPSGQQAGRIVIELMKSAPQASSLQSEKSVERADKTEVNMAAEILAADVDSSKPDRHAGQSSSLHRSPEPMAGQDVETRSQPLSANVADHSSSASKNDPSHLLKLIYTEINKHKHYPYVARRQGREGLVKLNFVMHPDGAVTDIAVVQTSHFSALDNAARNAVQAISPFRRAAEFLDTVHRYDVNIDFRLN